jgi:hypothetical protein
VLEVNVTKRGEDRDAGIAVHVMGGFLCASLFLFVLSLPPFHFGLSVQTETAATGLHVITAALALCTASMLFRGDPALRRDLRHPLFLLLLLLVAWTTFTGALSGRLLASLSGPLDQGVGGLAIIEGGIICVAARQVLRFPAWRRAVAASAVAAFAAILVLDASGRTPGGMAPYYFGDYIAFVAFAFLALVFSLAGKRRRIAIAVGVPVAAWAIMQSGNKAGLLGFALMIFIALVVWRMPNRYRKPVIFMPVLLAVAMPVAIYLVGSAYVPEDFDRLINAYGHALVPAFLLSVWASLWSRAMLLKVSLPDVFGGPGGVLGSGWGSFGDSLVRNLRLVDSRHHEFVGDTLTYWDAIQRTDFHSHNFMIEALLAGGPVAALIVLYVLWRLAHIWWSRGDLLPVAWLSGLVPVAAFWFQLPLTVAWLAIAVAAMTPERRDAEAGQTGRSGKLPVACALMTALMLSVVAMSAMRDTLTAGALLRNGLATSEIADRCNGSDLTTWHADAYLAQLVSIQAERFTTAVADHDRQEKGARLSALICHAGYRISEHQPLKLVSTLVNAAGLLRFVSGDEVMSGPAGELVARWDGLADKLILMAPDRTDLLIPYYNHLLLEGREERLMTLTGRALDSSPEEPVSLWFSGLVLLGSGVTAKDGLDRLKAAARNGISILMPISDDLRNAVGLPVR